MKKNRKTLIYKRTINAVRKAFKQWKHELFLDGLLPSCFVPNTNLEKVLIKIEIVPIINLYPEEEEKFAINILVSDRLTKKPFIGYPFPILLKSFPVNPNHFNMNYFDKMTDEIFRLIRYKLSGRHDSPFLTFSFERKSKSVFRRRKFRFHEYATRRFLDEMVEVKVVTSEMLNALLNRG